MGFAEFVKHESAREFFRSIPGTVRRMDEARLILDFGLDAFARTGDGVGGGNQDPTASAAIHLADHEWKARDAAKRTVVECEDVIGTALEVIAAVGVGIGKKYALVLDLHYVDCLSEKDTAEQLGISRASVKRLICIACDWCDWRGVKLFQ